MPNISRAFVMAYQRWLYTQTHKVQNKNWLCRQETEIDPFIMDVKELYASRAPGANLSFCFTIACRHT